MPLGQWRNLYFILEDGRYERLPWNRFTFTLTIDQVDAGEQDLIAVKAQTMGGQDALRPGEIAVLHDLEVVRQSHAGCDQAGLRFFD
jgi:hypothetical protein